MTVLLYEEIRIIFNIDAAVESPFCAKLDLTIDRIVEVVGHGSLGAVIINPVPTHKGPVLAFGNVAVFLRGNVSSFPLVKAKERYIRARTIILVCFGYLVIEIIQVVKLGIALRDIIVLIHTGAVCAIDIQRITQVRRESAFAAVSIFILHVDIVVDMAAVSCRVLIAQLYIILRTESVLTDPFAIGAVEVGGLVTAVFAVSRTLYDRLILVIQDLLAGDRIQLIQNTAVECSSAGTIIR